MAVLNIEKSFLTENRSVIDFLNQPGQGLYIPLYQRDYSWDSDNIEQLLEDLSRGIQRIALGEIADDSKEIRFLGTIITVVESNKTQIYPVEIQAVPPRIEKLIDGQQRVSTIALMATLLTKQLTDIKQKVKTDNPIYEQVNEICNLWIDQKLAPIFSFDLGRGTPRLKPKIIRGAKDYWTRADDVDVAYKSELANYLGHFIKAYVDKSTFPMMTKEKFGNTLLYQNGRKIESWLKKTVSVAHEKQNDEFATAEDILKHFSQDLLWDFERPDLVAIVEEKNYSDKKTNSYILSELLQTLSVCHYLLDRCCFTIIQPTDDDWAFDMFQSLNATGTPLTAIETFKPTIVNTMDNEPGCQFKDSNSDKSFKKVEDFLSEATTAQQKNKRTNDYLTSFFVAYDGRTMSTHFSYQRKVLQNVYDSFESIEDRELFVKRMGNYAEFYQLWTKYDGRNDSLFPNIGTSEDANLASMLILFLRSSNHKMAITMLGRMYDCVIENKPNAVTSFINMVKVVAAYYFLWRAAYSNSGLDSTYRDFFKQKKEISLDSVKEYLRTVLENKGIGKKSDWITKAKSYLKYDTTGKEIIRLALLLAAHDTTNNPANRGTIMLGREGSQNYLNIDKWTSMDLKTIEHIAPQSNNDGMWDIELYDTHTELYQTLGNLTLLPQNLNASAGKKGWKEKLLYYQCVAEENPDKLQDVENIAQSIGVTLNPDSIALLKESRFNKHLTSISSLTIEDGWNKDLVERRTDAILNVIWDRVSKWLFS